MFKKFISMATAVFLMVSGISFVGSTSASGMAPTLSNITDSGVTVNISSFMATNPPFNVDIRIFAATTPAIVTPQIVPLSDALLTIQVPNGTTSIVVTGLSSGTSYRAGLVGRDGDGSTNKVYDAPSFTTSGSAPAPAPSTPAEIAAAAAAQVAAVAAAARAAEAVAAAIRAAEIATAQTSLATVLRGDKAGSLSEYRAANINVTTAASLTRLNAEVLKLSAADRADFAKIKAIADKIEFDESFFNATARPSIATYTANGVTGMTERILPVMNAKILELPVALRADIKAIQELVQVESFVDRVANTQTRASVSAAALVSRGLLTADFPRRHSVVRGLASYPEGSLNTMAKIEAAIKEQIAISEAPRLRLAEIRAKIAARKR